MSIQSEFPSFDWFIATDGDPSQSRVLGIRKLVDQSPFRLSDLRARGFRTESVRHPIRPPIKGIVEHYLLAELLSSAEAKVSLCMHVAPEEWYVLDEHRVIRA